MSFFVFVLLGISQICGSYENGEENFICISNSWSKTHNGYVVSFNIGGKDGEHYLHDHTCNMVDEKFVLNCWNWDKSFVSSSEIVVHQDGSLEVLGYRFGMVSKDHGIPLWGSSEPVKPLTGP